MFFLLFTPKKIPLTPKKDKFFTLWVKLLKSLKRVDEYKILNEGLQKFNFFLSYFRKE
jgi:hypothetical protein